MDDAVRPPVTGRNDPMPTSQTSCPICDNDLGQPSRPLSDGSGYFFDCPHCGPFRLTEEAVEDISTYSQSNPGNHPFVPHAIRRMRSDGRGGPMIFQETLEQIFKDPPRPTPREQGDNLIRWIGDNNTDPGAGLWVNFISDGGVVGAPTSKGLEYILRSSEGEGLIECDRTVDGETVATGIAAKLSFKGWDRYEELKKGAASGTTAFLAMEFGNENLNNVVEVCFRPAVAEAGFELRRLDDPEHQRAGLIDDRLRIEIKAARFLISDLTHENSGSYWEAGYAEGLGKPVIYTCEKTVFESRDGGTHFDTNHHLHILWTEDTLDEVAKNLKACIRATIPEAKQDD